ncbi:amidohydrolase [Veillonella sp. R32]|uniref:amidohydrolase family protein n=1 Tax=Veillonella sp. R32 TaxID=2021312 RepID=UPI00138A23C5|nr:amidohydrolase family protein [Veillonella sp. R32]KAF1682065.1 2-pyrone-4,6-dicarboxylate hydrolase [Veillonella sp. R32]
MNKYKLPPGACNCHLHIIDPKFPNDGKAKHQIGTISDYKRIAKKLTLDKAVFVQAKPFRLDNTCLLDAIQRFGENYSVGIAVTNNLITDQELFELHLKGIRGLRFSMWNPNNAVVSFNDCLPLSERIKEFNWNIQLHLSPEQLLNSYDMIKNLNCNIVLDHMARLESYTNPIFSKICKLIDLGHTWIKLSGPYLNSKENAPWTTVNDLAKTLISYAPERMLWGSDWPHVTEKNKYDEKLFIELLYQWIPSKTILNQILVKNPNEVYNFKNS